MPKKKKETTDGPLPLLGRTGNNLKMGIVGVPNVGKSTLFNQLSKLYVPAENYPFCTIDPNVAKVPVPDKRFDFLCKYWDSPSRIPAFLTITDIAGLVAGASEGKGLGNAFLSHISAVDGIYHVVRAFSSKKVTHVEGSVDPIRDLEVISKELVLKDIAHCKNTMVGLKKMVDRGMDKTKAYDLAVAEKALAALESGKDIRAVKWDAREIEWINSMLFLTAKPVVYLVNVSKKNYETGKNKHIANIKEWVEKRSPGAQVIPFSAKFEMDKAENESKEEPKSEKENDKKGKDGGKKKKIPKSQLTKIILSGYKCLNLIYFFTAGEKEVRCWTIRDGTVAKKAAGVIHGDFELGFQSAEVMAYSDFKELGSQDAVRKAGRLRTQGRDYIVADGDIMVFKASAVTKKKK